MLAADSVEAREAFDEIYARYSTRILTYCKKVMQNDELAEDIFQEAFIRLYEGAKKDRVMTNLSHFLIKMVRNLCLNEKNKRSKDHVKVEDLELPVYDASYETAQMSDILETAIQTLPEKYREVLILKEYLDMSYEEIADALELTLAVVRVRIYRAKVKLREILSPYLNEMKKYNNSN